MKTPKYKAGDKVVIVSKKVESMNPEGKMDKYLGTVMTIKKVDYNYGVMQSYSMEEDMYDLIYIGGTSGWSWSDDMIDHEATAKLNNKEEKTMETKAKLIIDGKEFEVALPDSVIAELTKPKRVTGFEAAEYGKTVYCVNECGNLTSYQDYGEAAKEYNVANYYTDKALAEWCCRADTLNRKMRRWAAEHNTEPIKWNGEGRDRYVIVYVLRENTLLIKNYNYGLHLGQTYFSDKEIAEAAIVEFGDEIKWLAENRPEWF